MKSRRSSPFPLWLLPFRDTVPYPPHGQIPPKGPVIPLVRNESTRATTQPTHLAAFHSGNGTGNVVTSSIRKHHSQGPAIPFYDGMTLAGRASTGSTDQLSSLFARTNEHPVTLFEVKLSLKLQFCKKYIPDTDKSSIPCPSSESAPCRGIAAVFSWKIGPSTSCCQNEENGFEDLLIVAGGRPAAALPERCG